MFVDELLRLPQMRRYSVEDVQRVVSSNDKQRFHMEQNPDNERLWIRANQGHTMRVEGLELSPIMSTEDCAVVIHGTFSRNWESIQKQGLSRMDRNHIHFAPGEPGDSEVISGMRTSCDILIYIDMQKALEEGIEFYRSANNVILSPGDDCGFIAPKYFEKVCLRQPRKELLFDKGT